MDPVRRAMAARDAGDFDAALRVLAGIADDLRRDDPAMPPLPFMVLGIVSEELRALAEQELAEPETIGRLLGEHQAGLPPPLE